MAEDKKNGPLDSIKRKSLDDRMHDVWGMDPNAHRLSMLPYPKGMMGDAGPDLTDWTAPSWLYGGLKSLGSAGHFANGGNLTPEEISNAVLTLGRIRGVTASAIGGAPSGTLGANAFQAMARPRGTLTPSTLARMKLFSQNSKTSN